MAGNSRRWASPFTMTFQLTTFQGVRPALFNYNTPASPAAMPTLTITPWTNLARAASNGRFPSGKTITLTSGADGSFLAADTRSNVLVNVAATGSGGRRTRSSRCRSWPRAAWP